MADAMHYTPEQAQELQEIQRRRQLAQMLSQQAMGGLNQPTQMVGNRAVRQSPLSFIAQALTGYLGNRMDAEGQEAAAALQKKAAEGRQAEMARILALPPEQRGTQAAGSVYPNVQAQAPFFQGSYEKETDRAQRTAFKEGDWKIDRERMEADSAYRAANLKRLDAELAESIRRGDQAQAVRLEQLRQNWAKIGIDREELGLKGRALELKAPANKPMPAAALKLQGDEIDAIQTAESLNADLKALSGQIDSGQLKLGPLANLESRARNLAGISSPESRNYASMKATLEKLRNDSLRLNKGVQTEGDAVRAWNELFENLNDSKVVRQRLGELQKLNERASSLRKVQVDLLRSNYGLPSIEVPTIAPVSPAVGSPPATEQLPPGVRRVQ